MQAQTSWLSQPKKQRTQNLCVFGSNSCLLFHYMYVQIIYDAIDRERAGGWNGIDRN